MKKTIRTLSMVMMALAMALCFLFAGLTFVRADVLAEVDQSAIDTAAVYIGPLDNFDVNETGIKFTAKIKKTDYYGLTGGVDAIGNNEVHLGVEVSRANADGSYTILPNAHYTVDTAGTLQTYNVGGVELEDYFMYSFTIKYNLERIFGENFDANDATIAKNINFMYADELCIRPFYQVISEVDGAGPRVYGEYGASRSMVHVAMAEYADVNSTLSPEEKELFISKYVSGKEDKGEIEVYADGYTNVTLDSSAKTYTIGTSGKVVAREDGKIDFSALEGLTIGDTFDLFGYTADRKVIVYHATYKGFTGIETTKIDEEFVLDESGKLYLNNTQFEGQEIESLFYSDGNFLEKATITEEVGNKIGNGGLVARVGGNYYTLSNVLYVTKAYENTKESRLAFRDLFSAGTNRTAPVYANGSTSKTLDGYYVLLENITFDHSVLPMSADLDSSAYATDARTAPYELFNNYADGTCNTFSGTFDGRGYSLNNIGLAGNYGIFGYAGDGAIVKNVAFNSMARYAHAIAFEETIDEVEYTYLYYTKSGASTGSYIFYRIAEAGAAVTFENVYVKDDNASDNGTFGATFFYNAITNADSSYDHGALTFKNVIVENAMGPVMCGATGRWAAGLTDNDVILDTYVITTKNIARDAPTVTANSRGENFVKYASLDAMKAVTTNDYSSFDSAYWTIEDGIPVWNTCNTFVTVKDSEDVAQSSIYAEEAGLEYTVSILVNGADETANISLATNNEAVATVSGNVITIAENAFGEATITVTYGGNEVATIAVTADTRVAIDISEEVLLSKADGKLYFNNTSLAGAEVTAVAYDGNSIFDGEKVDASAFTVNSDEPYALSIVTTTNKYNLTNVMVYDGVYANDNRKELVTLLSGYTTTLTGYYVLAENITFDTTATAERFNGASGRTFDATFDGRGYTINNLSFASGIYGAFGTIPGANAVIKNVAINRIFIVGAETATAYSSIIYGGAGATASAVATFENVYVYRYITESLAGRSYLLYYTNAGSAINWNMNNVIFEIEFAEELAHDNNGRGSGVVKTAAVSGTQTNTYFLTGAEYGNYVSKLPGVKNYNKYDTMESIRAMMLADNNDYSSFEATDCWTIKNGLPVWNTCNTVATMANAPTEVVTEAGKTYEVTAIENGVNDVTDNLVLELSGDEVVSVSGNVITVLNTVEGTATITVKYNDEAIATFEIEVNTLPVVSINGASVESVTSITAGETFTVTATAGGEDIAVELAKEDANNVINISGNVVTINENVVGTATVIVKIAGEEFARFDIDVDTRVAEDYNEEVLLSKADGKLYFNNTSLAGAEVTAVAYDGNSIFDGEKVDASAFTVNSDEPYALSIVTTTNKYNLTNVMVYDAVFENTTESREDLLEVLNATSANYKQNGYFVLAENITFVSGEKTAAGTDPFIGTFDGRGYTLNNLTIDNFNGLLGRGANVATLKNFALANVIGSGTYVSILSDRANAGEVFNLENVYIYYNSTADNRYHSFHGYNTNDGTGTWNLENVIFELEFTTTPTSTNSAKFLKSTAGEANNSYFIMNGPNYSTSAKFTSGNYKAYGGTTYTNTEEIYAVMAADGNNYRSFSSQYWTIVNGVPVWNTCNTVASVTNASDEKVTEITEVGEYTANALVNGIADDASKVTVETDSDKITVNDNMFTVGEGFYTATITVKYDGVALATYDVTIDTRVATEINEEVLISKLDDKFYFNGTSIEDSVVLSATYEGEPIYADGVVDTSVFEAVNTAYTVEVSTEDALYALTNVKVYDGVFDNSLASKQLMSTTFGSSNSTAQGAKVTELTGYFVLAENITFYDAEDTTTDFTTMMFGGSSNYGVQLFNATFDGRGFALKNVILDHSGSYCYGMFGVTMGKSAVLKNFAIDEIKFYKDDVYDNAPKASYHGLLASGAEALSNAEGNVSEMSNVYIRASIDSGNIRLFYNPKVDGVSTMAFSKYTNVLFHWVVGDDDTVRKNSYLISNNLIGTDEETGEISNTEGTQFSNAYFVINGLAWGGVHESTTITGYDGVYRYRNVAAMKAAGNDYSSFSSTYWTVAEGEIPVWNSLIVAE